MVTGKPSSGGGGGLDVWALLGLAGIWVARSRRFRAREIAKESSERAC
jgi:hypothetical protein